MNKLTKAQKNVIAAYASNGWNAGMQATGRMCKVYADCNGIEIEAAAAWYEQYDAARKQMGDRKIVIF